MTSVAIRFYALIFPDTRSSVAESEIESVNASLVWETCKKVGVQGKEFDKG